MQLPEVLRRFWRETVAPRPIAVGSAAAVAGGLALGLYLAAGASFERPPMQPVPRAARRVEPPPQPIVFEKDASGRTPDWVIGTDNIPGREPPRRSVRTVPDDADVAAAERRREGRGLGWLFAPWRWGRDDGPGTWRPSRRMEAYAEPPPRGRDRRYADEAEDIPPEDDWRRAEPSGPPRYPRYDPRFDPPYAPTYGPRYPDREFEPEEFDEEPPPPPPERWRYGR